MYFDSNESSSHKKAKEKLFDLIISKRVEILDQNGNKYEIFKGVQEKEFLHIESFIMDYINKAIFSNMESPCIKHLRDFNKKGLCDTNGYYGAFKELPCEKCVKINFGKYLSGSSKYASYRPDVSFGYNGLHKVWLEIKNESPCSKNKIEFCKQNDIILLEISDNDVLKFNDCNGKLIFNKLEEYIHIASIYEDIDEVITYIKAEIKDNKFAFMQEASHKLLKLPFSDGFLQPRNILLLQKRIENEFNIISIDNKELEKYFNINKKSKLIISKEEYDKLVELNYINKEETQDGIKVIEPSTNSVIVKCFKCKGKDQAKNLVKTEVIHRNNKRFKYFHEVCLENI